MNEWEIHDKNERLLFAENSLSALKYLVEHGREAEFTFDNHKCFISKFETENGFSLWVDDEEQSFKTMDELIQSAVIGKNAFKDVWKNIKIETLF